MGKHTVYHSGDTTIRNINGLAITVTHIVVKSVKKITTTAEGIVLLQISCNYANVNIMQVYGLLCENIEEEIDKERS